LSKQRTKEERDADRKVENNNHAVVSFDLQNVIALPRANISNFFYKRKLNVYNLTGHCAVGKDTRGFCAVWHEGISGRAGNDIASSLVKMLQEVVKAYPSVTDITLWSDSCIPQNKNCVMSCALIKFLQSCGQIQSLTQKFGEPGHSSVQEVDNLHSQIEHKLKLKDVYSPVGLLRVLKQVNTKKSLVIIQMRDFLDYKSASKKLSFSSLPYSKVKVIRYAKAEFLNSPTCESNVAVGYGVSFDQPLTDVAYNVSRVSRKRFVVDSSKMLPFPALEKCQTSTLSYEKVKDLKSMLKFMDSCDVEFYETIFPQKWKDKDTENTNESESEVMMPSEATVMDEAVEKKSSLKRSRSRPMRQFGKTKRSKGEESEETMNIEATVVEEAVMEKKQSLKRLRSMRHVGRKKTK